MRNAEEGLAAISTEHGYTECCHAAVTHADGGELCCKVCWLGIGNPEEQANWTCDPGTGDLIRRVPTRE